MSWTNEQVLLLIEEYVKYPCLYVIKHRDYHNKKVRSLALKQICEELSILKPSVTEAEVQKKFQGLRTTYSSERKKVLMSIRTGKKDDEIYKPALWYYDMMHFLNEQMIMRPSTSSYDSSSIEGDSECRALKAESIELDIQMDDESIAKGDPLFVSPVIISEDSRSTIRTSTPDSYARVPNSLEKMETVQSSSRLCQHESSASKTEEDVFGELVALQLKSIKDTNYRRQVQHDIHCILYKATTNPK